ncbi:MAG: NADH-quinone oxidoreductase subunit A [Candidatus Gastranaerophilales bacterium]|nr:NADH-quinone oxidoreductase subunit A [Candidatus Gastranaerophilales bacterium]
MFLGGFGAFFAFAVFSVMFAVAALVVSFILAPKAPSENKKSTYECGMQPKGEGQINFSVKYYMFAILFIIFEIEALFLFPWAVIFKKLGLFALIEAFIFVFVLLLGLVYACQKDLLEWRR